MSRTIKGYGWRRDSLDRRDWKYSLTHKPAVATTIPAKVDLRGYFPYCWDQGNLGACLPHATVGALEYNRIRLKLPFHMLSRLFLYYNARVLEGTASSDAGSEPRDIIKTLVSQGICAETLWPYDIDQFAVKPPADAYAAAPKWKISEYSRLSTLDDMLTCLASGHPFLFGFTVFESFESNQVAETGQVPMPGPNESVVGGHGVCLSGDTKIPLLNGTEISLKEMSISESKSFWVYSCDAAGNIVPGCAHSVRRTGSGKSTITIRLDNDSEVRCTPDHLFLMRDGRYSQARNLRVGDSLMPLYRKVDTNRLNGYEMLLSPRTSRWNYTHRIIASSSGRYNGTVHHADFNKRNNEPSNLVIMSWEDHTALHARHMDLLSAYAKSEIGRSNSREVMLAHWADPVWREEALKRLHENSKIAVLARKSKYKFGFTPDGLESVRKAARARGLVNHSQLHSLEAIRKSIETRKLKFVTDPKFRQKMVERARKNIAAHNIEVKNGKPMTQAQIDARRENIKIAFAAKMAKLIPHNHKISGIYDSGCDDVYDLTVDTWHNVAVSAGVFVHNCAVGFDLARKVFEVRNSWSPAWGMRGYFVIPFAYLTDPDLASDFWTIRSI